MRKSHYRKVRHRRINRRYRELAIACNVSLKEIKKLVAPYKGKTFFEAGYIYCPYIPVTTMFLHKTAREILNVN